MSEQLYGIASNPTPNAESSATETSSNGNILLPNEVEIKRDGRLLLTNFRLIWKSYDEAIYLPINEISFMGHKKETNWTLIILGIMSIIVGLGIIIFFTKKQESGSMMLLGLGLLAFGVFMIITANKKHVTFASSGGTITATDLPTANIPIWLDAVSAARLAFEGK